ncbi:hypothetical protein V5O48_012118, partial [Marasmius crinis-equi]
MPNAKPKETVIKLFCDKVTGVSHSSLLSLFSSRIERERGMETAPVPPCMPTQTMRTIRQRVFSLPLSTPSGPSTPVKGDLVIELKRKEQEREWERQAE